jgi:hypothetical protein
MSRIYTDEEHQYFRARNQMEKQHAKDMNALAQAFANSKSPFVVGDIVSQSGLIIEIKLISHSTEYSVPYAIYKGIRLTKNLEPYKNKEEIWFHTHSNSEPIKLIKKA